MVNKQARSAIVEAALNNRLDQTNLSFLGPKTNGKVRDIYTLDQELIIVTTDRLSAFDRILGLVPYKGQVLNQLAAFWFEELADIVDSHLLETPDPNVSVAQKCQPLPVEVVVRGYITGVTETALWRRYSEGERTIYGMTFREGLQKNDKLPTPVITPTTKALAGAHDERIASTQVVGRGLVDASLWGQVCEVAIAIFQRGQLVAEKAGLILVDTKYEFGLSPAGELVLIDEVHTPDSSRYWVADTYRDRIAEGQEPENFDKEFVRLTYAADGYRGDGDPQPLPDDLAVQLAERYIRACELLTKSEFVPGELPAGPRIERNLRDWLEGR